MTQTLKIWHEVRTMGHCPVVVESSRKMSDGAAQRSVAEDVALFKPRLGIEGMRIFPAGGLARKAALGKGLPPGTDIRSIEQALPGARRTRSRAWAGGPGSGGVGCFNSLLNSAIAISG